MYHRNSISQSDRKVSQRLPLCPGTKLFLSSVQEFEFIPAFLYPVSFPRNFLVSSLTRGSLPKTGPCAWLPPNSPSAAIFHSPPQGGLAILRSHPGPSVSPPPPADSRALPVSVLLLLQHLQHLIPPSLEYEEGNDQSSVQNCALGALNNAWQCYSDRNRWE